VPDLSSKPESPKLYIGVVYPKQEFDGYLRVFSARYMTMIPTFSSPSLALQSRLPAKGEREDALEPYSHWGMRVPCSPDPGP
jgi:hypothetical protein